MSFAVGMRSTKPTDVGKARPGGPPPGHAACNAALRFASAHNGSQCVATSAAQNKRRADVMAMPKIEPRALVLACGKRVLLLPPAASHHQLAIAALRAVVRQCRVYGGGRVRLGALDHEGRTQPVAAAPGFPLAQGWGGAGAGRGRGPPDRPGLLPDPPSWRPRSPASLSYRPAWCSRAWACSLW